MTHSYQLYSATNNVLSVRLDFVPTIEGNICHCINSHGPHPVLCHFFLLKKDTDLPVPNH